MSKAIAIIALVALAGCKDTIIQDNGPTHVEREIAMRNCVGQFLVRDAPQDIRLACTQAIYGGEDR